MDVPADPVAFPVRRLYPGGLFQVPLGPAAVRGYQYALYPVHAVITASTATAPSGRVKCVQRVASSSVA